MQNIGKKLNWRRNVCNSETSWVRRKSCLAIGTEISKEQAKRNGDFETM